MSNKVIIVGAGISGIAAAKKLHQSGLCDVTILEAGNRIGGRIRSAEFHGEMIELGAQWLHGIEENPLYKVVTEDLVHSEVSRLGATKYIPPQSSRVVRSDGSEVTGNNLAKFLEATRLLGDLENRAEYLIKESGIDAEKLTMIDCKSEAENLWDVKNKSYKDEEKLDESFSEATLQKVLTRMNIIDCDWCANVNVHQYHSFSEYDGPDLAFSGGYSTVVNTVAKNLPPSCIQLNCRVGCIEWDKSGNHPIRVNYHVENGDEMSLEADHVIVTISLGCLKKFHEDLFVPKLPIEKKTSIEKFGFGAMDKLILYYENPFWSVTDFPLYIVWNEETKIEKETKWFELVEAFMPFGRKSIYCWVTTTIAEAIGESTDDEIGQDVTKLFRKYLNNERIQEPDDVLRTNWRTDENFFGSYSCYKIGSNEDDVGVISAPLEVNGFPRVLFAGEATHKNRYSTTDGAFSTGVREAQRLIEFWGN